MNVAAEGKSYPPVRFEVAPDRVTAFRDLFDERGEDVVPPTFLTVAEFLVFPTVVSDPDVGIDFARVVHGEQEYEWKRQPRVGETLETRARIAAIRTRGALGMLTIETELRDDGDEIVAVCRATMIERPA